MSKEDLVIVTGKSSQLAQALQHYKEMRGNKRSPQLLLFDRAVLDLTSEESIQRALEPTIKRRDSYRNVVILNTAAYTQVDKAEEEPQKAWEVNAEGVRHLADVAAKNQFAILHISTDYVFDGKKNCPYTEEDLPKPLSVYGRTKLEGEKALAMLQHKGLAMVIRTSWLYYHTALHGNFLLTIIQKLREGIGLRVVNDQRATPTSAYDLAEFIFVALDKFFQEGQFRLPVLHFCNEGSATWYDFAVVIAASLTLSNEIHPVTTKQYPTRAVRPPYSRLSIQRLQSIYNYHPREWSQAVAESIQLLLKKEDEKRRKAIL